MIILVTFFGGQCTYRIAQHMVEFLCLNPKLKEHRGTRTPYSRGTAPALSPSTRVQTHRPHTIQNTAHPIRCDTSPLKALSYPLNGALCCKQCCGSECESERIRAFFAESESEIFVPDSDSDSDPVPDPVS
jgi:hypothetical protein